jgi:hypothetical protein
MLCIPSPLLAKSGSTLFNPWKFGPSSHFASGWELQLVGPQLLVLPLHFLSCHSTKVQVSCFVQGFAKMDTTCGDGCVQSFRN